MMYKTPSFDIWHDHFIGNSRLKTHVMLSEVEPPPKPKNQSFIKPGACPTEKRLAYFFAV